MSACEYIFNIQQYTQMNVHYCANYMVFLHYFCLFFVRKNWPAAAAMNKIACICSLVHPIRDIFFYQNANAMRTVCLYNDCLQCLILCKTSSKGTKKCIYTVLHAHEQFGIRTNNNELFQKNGKKSIERKKTRC